MNRACDGVVLVVDAVEGVMMHTETLIKHALYEGLAITLCINKVDRLLLELKLPPADAYYKLVHTLEEVSLSSQVKNGTLYLLISSNCCVSSPFNLHFFFLLLFVSLFSCLFVFCSSFSGKFFFIVARLTQDDQLVD